MVYRIYTKDKNRGELEELVSQYFDSFTIFEAIEYWKGNRKKSLIIEVLSLFDDYEDVKTLARNILRVNNQEAVVVSCLRHRIFPTVLS